MEYSADQEREMQERHDQGHSRSAGTGAPDGCPSSDTRDPIRMTATACGVLRYLTPSCFSRGLPLPPSPPARVHQVWPGRNVSMVVSVYRDIYLCYLSLHWELKLRDHGGTVQSGVCNCSQCFFLDRMANVQFTFTTGLYAHLI